MSLKTYVCLCFLATLALSAYQPEMMLTTTVDLINKELIANGDTISKTINSYSVADIHFQQKVSGVNTKFNLTKIKQKIDINWKTNIISVKDQRTLIINSKNVNVTLDGELQLKIALLRKQKGPLKVSITQLELDITVRFLESQCPNSVGFNIEIKDVFVNVKNITVKLEGHAFDNLIIKEVERVLIPRIPTLVASAIKDKVNPLITSYTCNRVSEIVPINNHEYVLTINTTKVPEFDSKLKYLGVPIDITFQNMETNETNDELQKDDLPKSTAFQNTSDLTLSLSSNFLNTIVWLVDDADLLKGVVTNSMLGDNPPILLNTTNLSILMPKLKEKWPNKQVFLMIEPSSKYQHLLIRSGRLISIINLSVQFVVNVTGKPLDVDACLQTGDCVVACNLNMTLPLSLAIKIDRKLINGLIHSAQFFDISIIESQIDINLVTLKSIINEIVGSMLPDNNNQLSQGMPFPQQLIDILSKYNVGNLKAKTFQDFMALGLNIVI